MGMQAVAFSLNLNSSTHGSRRESDIKLQALMNERRLGQCELNEWVSGQWKGNEWVTGSVNWNPWRAP